MCNLLSPITSSPLVTLSIVSHRDSEKTNSLLGSIGRYDNLDNIQIIITDNLGEQGFRESLARDVFFLQNDMPKGFAHNHNQAFKYAQGEYFCVLNPDILFIEPVFETLIHLIENDHADIIAPLIVDSKGVLQDSFRKLPSPQELIFRRLGKKQPLKTPSVPISPDWLAGMFLFMRTDTFRALGGFDERYHLYFEDVDFSTRARLAGLRVLLDPALRVQHDAHRGSRRSLKYLFWHMQSAWKFFSSETYREAKEIGDGIIAA